jgi:hypothetical protein
MTVVPWQPRGGAQCEEGRKNHAQGLIRLRECCGIIEVTTGYPEKAMTPTVLTLRGGSPEWQELCKVGMHQDGDVVRLAAYAGKRVVRWCDQLHPSALWQKKKLWVMVAYSTVPLYDQASGSI